MKGWVKITLRATPDDTPEEAIDTLIETNPGLWGLFGGDVMNPLPIAKEVCAVEAQIGALL